MSTRQNNTMAEFCSKMMKTIAEAKQEPDSDDEFLGALEGDILAYLKPPAPGGPGAGGAPGDPNAAMGPAMAQVMGGSGGGGAPMGGAPMMASAGPAMGNPDEFRRMMGKSVDRGLIAKLTKNGLV